MKFADKVYKVTKQIPKGKVATYKVIADKLNTKAYRAVGQALRCNPYAPVVPCHRVVASDGTIGGFSGQTKGPKITKKISMLRKEGIIVEKRRVKNFEKKLWS